MTRFVVGAERSQSTLFPERLEDYLSEDNPVRAIDVFVDELDLAKLGFGGVEPEATGRPAYHPTTLLKIYVYGYLNRVQSSRRLERECQRNIELVWLTGRLMPDFKTIADFRKDNGEAIRKVCREFVVLCRRLKLFDEASVAIDGSKFKAVNTRDRNFTQAKMQRRLAQIDESIARYLSQLDSADRQGEAVPEAKVTRLNEKIATLRQEIQRLNALNVQMMQTEDKQISLTDPDARSMATSGRGSGMVGYNVQNAVDTKHHLIVAHEVTNVGSDRSQLSRMAEQARAAIGSEAIEAVADRGYYSGEEIVACEQAGVTVYLPKPMTSGINAKGRFGKQVSLSQTLSGWQLIENRAMLSRDERSCQARCLDGRRSVSVAGSARGGNSDVAAADKRSAANRSQETNLQLHRPIDFCLPLSASPWRSRCAGDC
jgi:transposase